MFSWFWRFLAMAILVGLVALAAYWGRDAIYAWEHWESFLWLTRALVYVEVLAMFGAGIALIGAGLTGLVGVVLFIFRKAMES